MRISTLLAFFGAATLSASAFAAPAATSDAGSPATVTIQGEHPLRASDVDGITGRYNLADGQTLRVSFEHRKLFAEVGSRKSELVRVTQNTFVARADDMKLVFDQVPFATDVVLSQK